MATTIGTLVLTPKKTKKLETACEFSFIAYTDENEPITETFCIKVFEAKSKRSKQEKQVDRPEVFLRSGKNALRKITFKKKISRDGTKVEKDFEVLITGSPVAKNVIIELRLPGDDGFLSARTLLYTKS